MSMVKAIQEVDCWHIPMMKDWVPEVTFFNWMYAGSGTVDDTDPSEPSVQVIVNGLPN